MPGTYVIEADGVTTRPTHSPADSTRPWRRRLDGVSKPLIAMMLSVVFVLLSCSSNEQSESPYPTIDAGQARLAPLDGDATGSDAQLDSSSDSPERAALLGVTADDGVCAAFDAVFDFLFSDEGTRARIASVDGDNIVDELTSGSEAVLLEVGDGPFGERWHELAQRLAQAERDGVEPDLSAAMMVELDQLSVEQCGYPVISALGETARLNCLTRINPDGSRGEPSCNPAGDPRPS